MLHWWSYVKTQLSKTRKKRAEMLLIRLLGNENYFETILGSAFLFRISATLNFLLLNTRNSLKRCMFWYRKGLI